MHDPEDQDGFRDCASRNWSRAIPLQNRVDPFGAIHAVESRGMFTGNRGIIHDPATKTLLKRRWSAKAWIICECSFRGRRRDVMGRNAPSGRASWTELFFLDEVTALAAGHRPCFYCRREKAREFATCFADAFRVAAPKAGEMDELLHSQRLASGGKARPLAPREVETLPDGAVVSAGCDAFALRAGRLLPWSFAGYGKSLGISEVDGEWRLITPPATVAVLAKGYRPKWHLDMPRA